MKSTNDALACARKSLLCGALLESCVLRSGSIFRFLPPRYRGLSCRLVILLSLPLIRTDLFGTADQIFHGLPRVVRRGIALPSNEVLARALLPAQARDLVDAVQSFLLRLLEWRLRRARRPRLLRRRRRSRGWCA